MPRFQKQNFSANKGLIPEFRNIADEAIGTPTQLALTWVLRRDENVNVIPGATSVEHLEESVGAMPFFLSLTELPLMKKARSCRWL